ncbi:LysR family transcriptional regulator [Staphylococcus equorum]|uniref:LysR family transcriptional regulator n=1 Tax=Staphylococcus equorum TaxID=246432 RepID=UPI00080741DC|nr:LysR family transcriptional regulator [Staphylococcus equorum]ANR69525.1 LysR family transcriptional regulator [Staphylococcus equorum]
MEFKDLKIFQSVSDHESISRAAESLNYVQSHVTSRIKSLEAELNTKLFLRHNKGTTLTSEGRKLEEYVQQILKTMNEINDEFGDTEQPTGRLNIGTVETVTKLPNVLSMFRISCPKVSLSIDTDVTEKITKKVVDKTLDCAFISGFDNHTLINKIELFQEKLILISSDKNMSLKDLSLMPMLVFKNGCNYRRNLKLWLNDINVKNPKLVEFGTLETIIGSVKSGLGISLVPESTVSNYLEKEDLYSYDLPEKYSKISTDFIWHKQAFLTSTMDNFIQTVKHYKGNYIN